MFKFSNIAVNLLTLCDGISETSGVNCLALSVLSAASGVKFGLPVAPPGGRWAMVLSVQYLDAWRTFTKTTFYVVLTQADMHS